jgi:hypothetical protein
MDGRERIKNQLESWGFRMESESPIVLVSTEEGYEEIKLTGLLAQLKIDEVIDSLKYEDGYVEEVDFNSLYELDSDDKLLVTADINYLDEFTISEWTTMKVEYFRHIVEKLEYHDEKIEWSFGAKQDISYENGKELLQYISFKVITEEEYFALKTVFNGVFDSGSNVFNTINSLFSNAENEDNKIRHLFKLIENLKQFGWDISIYDEFKELFEYVDNNTGDRSIDNIDFIETLTDHYRNKNILK